MVCSTTVVNICWGVVEAETAIYILESFLSEKNKRDGYDKNTAKEAIIKLQEGVKANIKSKEIGLIVLTLSQANMLNRQLMRFIKLTKSDNLREEKQLSIDMSQYLTCAISL